MALISSKEHMVAISIANRLQVLNTEANAAHFSHTNSLDTDDKESNEATFIQHLYAPNNSHFAAITANKKLLLWDTTNNNDRSTEPTAFLLPKRPTCMCFCNKDSAVLVGDKTGDVYRCQFGPTVNPVPQLLLGHLSMVLDVGVSPDDSFVVSVDRDEKVRVSHYPNAYNILNYCLGHNQLVSTFAFTSPDVLVSGSGDETLRLWAFKEGREIGHCSTSDVEPTMKVVSKIVYHNNTLAVISEQSDAVLFVNCEADELKSQRVHRLGRQPYDMCYRSGGQLLVLVNDLEHPVVCLQETPDQNAYVQTNVDLSLAAFFDSGALPGVLKTYTDLLKVDALKRLQVDITPDATINNVVFERNCQPVPEVVSA